LHPVQDVQADVLAINNKLKSRSEALLERGYDAELIDREIASDMAREQRLGLSGNRSDRREPTNSAA
jgi:capsid protein